MAVNARKTTLVQDDWFESWFDSDHYHRLYAGRDEREAAAFLDRLIDALPLRIGSSLLDLGCGAGRHANHLAGRGFEVTGIDLSARSIARARAASPGGVRFVRQDMRQPFGTATFDEILSLFTSFGYFDDPADNLTVLHHVAAALKRGGRLVLDYLNAPFAAARLVAEETVVRDGCTYRITRRADAAAIHKRILVEEPGTALPLVHEERVSRFGLDDLMFMLEVCGLHLEAVYGDYALEAFDVETSPRLILVARR